MAHHIKVETVAALNKDGSISKSRKTHFVTHRGRRGGKVIIAKCDTKKAANNAVVNFRQELVLQHLAKHPNDKAFIAKHDLVDQA